MPTVPAAPAPILVDVNGVAALLGVGLRTVHKLRHEPEFPQPVALGARATRWKVAEVVAWVESRPRVADRPEPAELTRARAAKRATGGSEGGAGGGLESPPAGNPRRPRRLKSGADFVPPKGQKSNPGKGAAA
jgi:predicted DNA-binding transcriptional regulator AlpA